MLIPLTFSIDSLRIVLMVILWKVFVSVLGDCTVFLHFLGIALVLFHYLLLCFELLSIERFVVFDHLGNCSSDIVLDFFVLEVFFCIKWPSK